MTEEKFTKLAEEDLDLVAGGTMHKDVFVFKLESGKYKIIQFSCDLDDASYKKVYAKASQGIVPDIFDLQLSGSSSCYPISAEKYASYIKDREKEGFSIHKM